MRQINLETWHRFEHFKLFNAYDHPHFGITANVDLTAFYPLVKQRGIPFTVATVYVLARAANDIPEFRYRIRAGEVVEHEIVHPSTTILTGKDLFSFCTFDYVEKFAEFTANAVDRIAYVQEHLRLEDEQGRNDLLFMTGIPWVSFTSVIHPMHLQATDSVPRFAWGKFFEEGEVLKMPLNVQAHHGLLDGIHMGRFYAKVQDYLNDPGFILGEQR